MSDVRVRFAPSPTGYLHVGGARTVLFNWIYARQRGGQFLIRIEDTDKTRSQPELTDNILEMIEWLGFDWDEPPVHSSDRLDAHVAAAKQLQERGQTYYCDCTKEAVEERARARKAPPGYDGFCRDRGLDDAPDRALRFRTPRDGVTVFDDLIRGRVEVANATVEDFVLLRGDGSPVFLLANAVDDADMAITHVLRGEDHVAGTTRYLLIRNALGFGEPPVFAHLPLLVNEKRQKLSKRRDDVSVVDYKNRGILPEAMVNYLALLGWGPPDGVEIRPFAEIVDLWRIEDVNSAPAFFDLKKLSHFNGSYIRSLPLDEFLERARPFLADHEGANDALVAIAPDVQERVTTLAEVDVYIDFLYLDEPKFDEREWEKVAGRGDSAPILDAVIAAYESCVWEEGQLHEELGVIADNLAIKTKPVQLAVRVAVTGRAVGPPLFKPLTVLGRDRTLARLRAARARL